MIFSSRVSTLPISLKFLELIGIVANNACAPSHLQVSGHVTCILPLPLPFPSPSEDVPNREMISAARLVIYLNIMARSNYLTLTYVQSIRPARLSAIPDFQKNDAAMDFFAFSAKVERAERGFVGGDYEIFLSEALFQTQLLEAEDLSLTIKEIQTSIVELLWFRR